MVFIRTQTGRAILAKGKYIYPSCHSGYIWIWDMLVLTLAMYLKEHKNIAQLRQSSIQMWEISMERIG